MMQLLRARLSRKIAKWVLVSIILIETLVVIPTHFVSQQRLLNQLEASGLSTIQPIINLANVGISPSEFPAIVGDLTPGTVVKGGIIYRRTGEPVVEFGEFPSTALQSVAQSSIDTITAQPGRMLYNEPARYDVFWTADELAGNYHVAARLDASFVNQTLFSQTINTILIVFLICVVVTGGTMLAVGLTTISPVVQLRASLLATAWGQSQVDRKPLPEDREDELGDVMQAFNVMAHNIEQRTTDLERVAEQLQMANVHLQDLNDRLQHELALARRIQRSLLPPPEPTWEGLEVICYSSPASAVGGDFYAYNQLGPQTYTLAVGDVSGKGMSAALIMAVSIAALGAAHNKDCPEQLLHEVHEALLPYTSSINRNTAMVYTTLQRNLLPVSEPGQTAPCLYQVTAANAGCINPIVRRQNGEVEWIDVGGIPLGSGFGTSPNYQEASFCLSAGDMLVLTSDGVVEATNNHRQMFGFGRFEEAMRSGPPSGPPGGAAAMLEHLKQKVNEFAADLEQHDDITIVVVQA